MRCGADCNDRVTSNGFPKQRSAVAAGSSGRSGRTAGAEVTPGRLTPVAAQRWGHARPARLRPQSTSPRSAAPPPARRVLGTSRPRGDAASRRGAVGHAACRSGARRLRLAGLARLRRHADGPRRARVHGVRGRGGRAPVHGPHPGLARARLLGFESGPRVPETMSAALLVARASLTGRRGGVVRIAVCGDDLRRPERRDAVLRGVDLELGPGATGATYASIADVALAA